jgi:hypothetical protein
MVIVGAGMDLHSASPRSSGHQAPIFDLISYRGSGKGCATIADKVELIVTE